MTAQMALTAPILETETTVMTTQMAKMEQTETMPEQMEDGDGGAERENGADGDAVDDGSDGQEGEDSADGVLSSSSSTGTPITSASEVLFVSPILCLQSFACRVV